MEVSEDIMRNRHAWFWRRVTLQFTLVVLSLILASTLVASGARTGDWPTTAVQIAIVVALCWLNTMYFAAVDSADKLAKVVNEVTEAVDAARSHG